MQRGGGEARAKSSGPQGRGPSGGNLAHHAGAVTAAAHKLARILYTMIKTRTAFDPAKLGNPDLIRQRKERSLRKQATLLGFSLQPTNAGAVS